jgi:hypothetical protein
LRRKAHRARPQDVDDVLVDVERGQRDHAGVGPGGDLPGRLDAVHAGHPQVHQDHLGRRRRWRRGRLAAVGGLTHDLHPAELEDHPQAVTDEVLVVDEEHPRHAWAPSGICTRRLNRPSATWAA